MPTDFNLLLKDEKIISQFSHHQNQLIITDNRIVQHNGSLLNHSYKDLSLNKVSSLEHKKRKYPSLLVIGILCILITFFTRLYFKEYLLIAGVIFIILFFLIVRKVVYIHGDGNSITWYDNNEEIIRSIRKILQK
ncbi:MAG TPA: hypothetical protein VJB87_03830 [Candidatus Nanoarchaeia archaeon]|nr:hypothetical protein [Candidatus Nanoarchaeia archaeon]